MIPSIPSLIYEVKVVSVFEKLRSVRVFIAVISLVVTLPFIALFIRSSLGTHFDVLANYQLL